MDLLASSILHRYLESIKLIEVSERVILLVL